MAELLVKGTTFSRYGCHLPPICRSRAKPFFPVSNFFGKKLLSETQKWKISHKKLHRVPVQMIGKALRWWEKGGHPNMKEISSAQELVDSLMDSGDKLVVVDFFSPGCAGCRTLHPKICQFAEMNSDVVFLQINYEMNKSMCYSLNIHVLPFFRLYRGAHGRLCSFSCTNATIKKFRDALAKHGTERCGLGPAKGLEEAELMALEANKDLCFHYNGKGLVTELNSAIKESSGSRASEHRAMANV